ncbi:MAG TPA: hypothetical protein VKS79_00815 [Gemmataceae bacterium]|nr:hypothetical protein [Gemmataceae bacterium]
MKPIFTISAVAVCFFVATSPCFALWWERNISTKAEAKEIGMEVRSELAGPPNQISVILDFKADGELKNFSYVVLQIGEGENSLVTASLQPDRSKPGRVVVGFTAHRSQLDKATLRVSVPMPEALGGCIYNIRVKDFVDPKKDR